MVILKIPKLVRALRKTKQKWYSKGWKECAKEKDEFIETLRAEKAKEVKSLIDELNDCRISQKDKYERLKKESENERLELKTEMDKRIADVRKVASDEIEKANQKEQEYYTLLSKLRTLFHEGAVKFLITAEEQENLMGDMSRIIHRKNQFMQLSQEFDKVMKENSKLIDTTRLKQLGDK